MILCWKPGQKSPIHNHPNQGCIMKIIKGKLLEHKYEIDQLKFVNQNIYQKDDVSYIDNSHCVHKISNIYPEKAISLHCYSPGTFKATIYSSDCKK